MHATHFPSIWLHALQFSSTPHDTHFPLLLKLDGSHISHSLAGLCFGVLVVFDMQFFSMWELQDETL